MSYKPKNRKNILREKIFKKIFFKYFLPASIIVVLSIQIFNASFLKIENISFMNASYINENLLKEIIKEQISKKYFGIYNKNNFIFYPESKIEKELKAQEKRIKSVNIVYDNFFSRNIKIDIEERVAIYLYCENKKKDCYFIDKDGKIFAEFNSEETDTKKEDFLVFEVRKKEKVEMDRFWTYYKFEKIINLIEKIDNIGIKIVRVEKKDFEEIIFHTKNKTKIVINKNQDFLKIPRTLTRLSTREDLKIDKNKKDFVKKISYINLSFGEKVYVCFVGEICQKNH